LFIYYNISFTQKQAGQCKTVVFCLKFVFARKSEKIHQKGPIIQSIREGYAFYKLFFAFFGGKKLS